MRMLELDVPEYFVNAVGQVERLGSCVRLTMGLRRAEIIEPRYVCIWPIDALMSRNELIGLMAQDVLGEKAKH